MTWRSKTIHYVMVILAAILALGACNKTPPNLTPTGAAAFRIEQVVVAIDAIGDAAVSAEKNGFIDHSETLKIADVVSRAAHAAGDLGRAFQAGEGEVARAKTVAIIRKALTELPDNLSAHGREVAKPFINVALSLLNLVG